MEPGFCKNCGKKFKKRHQKQVFCSLSCAGFHNSPGRSVSDGTKVKISKALRDTYAQHPDKIKRGDQHSKQVGKGTIGKYKGRGIKSILEVSKRTASKIIRRLGLGCSRCGWKEEIGDIHHIKGKKIPDPDNHSNLTYLCPNCHRLVHARKINPDSLIPLTDFFPTDWSDAYYG